jgi:hypothetical protein
MTWPAGTMAPLLAIMVAVPTSNTCRMWGAFAGPEGGDGGGH